MATYPAGTVGFTDKVNLTDIVNADDVNVLYHEVAAIAADLGTGTGLRTSPAWGNGTFSSSTTTWSGLTTRLQNIENGVYEAYRNFTDKRGGSTITPSNSNVTGLVVNAAGALTATAASRTSGSAVVTITLATGHGLVNGNTVTLSSIDSTVNGTWVIANVTSTTFTITGTATTALSLTGLTGVIVSQNVDLIQVKNYNNATTYLKVNSSGVLVATISGGTP